MTIITLCNNRRKLRGDTWKFSRKGKEKQWSTRCRRESLLPRYNIEGDVRWDLKILSNPLYKYKIFKTYFYTK